MSSVFCIIIIIIINTKVIMTISSLTKDVIGRHLVTICMRNLLHNEEHVRYNGRRVGVIGNHPHSKNTMFVWEQRRFQSLDGYSMSEGLVKRLNEKDVEMVFITDCECLTSLRSIEQSQKIGPTHEVFYNADKLPSEDQYVYTPE